MPTTRRHHHNPFPSFRSLPPGANRIFFSYNGIIYGHIRPSHHKTQIRQEQKQTGTGDFRMFRKILHVTSQHEGEIINLTPLVQQAIRESAIHDGLVHLFVQHSTAALTTIEFEPGVLSDLSRALAVVAPDDTVYAHNARWGDGNGRSHVKAALVGPSLTVPVEKCALACGTWQQVVLLELDVNAGRARNVICTVTGE
jgi:secondary thiamine-phosphate synthase enzyme